MMLLIAAAYLGAAVHASADRGVGVSTGEMIVRTLLVPGAGYTFPPVSVINTGTEPAVYQVAIGTLEGQAQRRPNPDWFRITPDEFLLQPGESRDVTMRIVLPAGVPPGEYLALLKAQTTTNTDATASLGVAAATKLTFTISSSGWFDARARELQRWLDQWSPWIYILAAAGVAFVLGTRGHIRPKLPFRVKLERK